VPQAALVTHDHGYRISKPPKHRTLVGYVWDTVQDKVRREGLVSSTRPEYHLSSAEVGSVLSNLDHWKTFTDSILLLLKTAYHGTTGELPEGRVFRALHASCAFDLGPDFVCFVARLYPRQFMQPEEDTGWLPLHFAAANRMNDSRFKRKVLTLLARRCPGAAMTLDSNLRLPLHIALESHVVWEDGISSLVTAAPRSLLVRDGRTGLFPALLSAVASSDRSWHAITRVHQGASVTRPLPALFINRRQYG